MSHLSVWRCDFIHIREDLLVCVLLKSPGQVDMHMLVILILMTAAHQHNTIARASDFCEHCNVPSHAVPFNEKHPVTARIRIRCAEGYVRKAGTSDLITCKKMEDGTTYWHTKLPLVCIPDPNKPPVTTETTTSTTERTELKNPTVLGTSMPTTGHITLTTTNEVVTNKTRRTTHQTTLKSTTKEAEPFTTTNEITSTNSTSSSFTSRDYMTTTSSHTPSSPFTTITGVTVCVNTSTVSEVNDKLEATIGHYTSKVAGVTSIIIICLAAAAVFLIWWRWRLRHRERDSPEASYIPVQLVYLHTDQLNQTLQSTNPQQTHVWNDTNQPQTGSAHSADNM
ncbi:unnamed protein product [Leuciscus chuanchicus]